MSKLALYPGSFDPITFGHIDIIRRGLNIFDRVTVGIGVNISKEPLFGLEERMEMINELFAEDDRVNVTSYDILTAMFAEEIGAMAIIRGLRAVSDFEYEFQMTLANRELFPAGETVFLMPSLNHVYLKSSLVKEVSRLGGDVSSFVPPSGEARLAEKYGD